MTPEEIAEIRRHDGYVDPADMTLGDIDRRKLLAAMVDLEADRDRARKIAVALEQENARLTEEVEQLRAEAAYDAQEAANFHAEEPF